MQQPRRPSRAVTLISALAALTALAAAVPAPGGRAKGKRARSVSPAVVAAPAAQPATAPAPPPSGFAPQVRLGYHDGDQWEPAIAADRHGNIYILYPQYLGVPGCAECPSPTMVLQVSRDRGTTWESPRPIALVGGPQYDAQVVVDPVDGRTVYAAWLQDGKSDIAVARSHDSGESWTVVIANATNAATDKPILAVRGSDVYVGYNHTQKVWVSSSHDGGETFTSAVVNPNGKLGWSLAGGGTVTPDGAVYFSWSGYRQNGQAKGPVNLYLSKSTDAGVTWSTILLDVSASPPDCSAYQCGWAYLGAQITLASDDAGTLYALWNRGAVDKGSERIYFARSEDGAQTWSARQDVSAAAAGAAHAFPAIVARGSGDVRISWMDARHGMVWNTYYRSSSDGGRRFSAESDLSTEVPGFGYIVPAGFSYPFGDYFELDIDDRGATHAIFGEGLNWNTPGSIWYARGR